MIFYPNKGESDGYTVKTKEEDFPISNYPLEQTEFYYDQKQGKTSFELYEKTEPFSSRL